jgi:hypothetical protein
VPTTLRSETAGLVRLAEADLAAIWRILSAGEGDPAEVLNDLLPGLIVEYGAMGAAVAADWYDEQRDLEGARGRFTAEPIEASHRDVYALVGFAVATASNDDALRGLILGGVQNRVADHVRLTVTGASVRDPAAKGWTRVGSGSTCDWCQNLIGEVFVTDTDFPSHDHCNCGPSPFF